MQSTSAIAIRLMFASSVGVCANACHAQFAFGLRPSLAATNAAIIVGIGPRLEQGTEAQVCATRLNREGCAPRVHRDGKPNPERHSDRGIVRIEIRCCTLLTLERPLDNCRLDAHEASSRHYRKCPVGGRQTSYYNNIDIVLHGSDDATVS